MTDMSVYTGSTWRVGYGEISERLQFRIGLIGNAAWQAVFPIVQLTDLIGILQGTASSAAGQLIYGVQLQGKRISDGFREQISIEPRSDQFPPAITLIQSADRADLLSVLQQLQAALPALPADDWDNSKPRRLGYDELPEALSPSNLSQTINSVLASSSFGISKITGLQTALDGKVSAGAAAGNVVLGSNNFHTPAADTNTGFEVVKSITNPDKTFLGAGSFYAVYFGTQQPNTGSIQGGAGESYSLMTGEITKAVLGWEGIGAAAGTGSYQQVIGLASTALAKDTTTVQQLMGYQARGPVGEGTPNVVNAYSIKVLEPTVGTERHSLHVTGRTSLVLGAHSKVLEIYGTSAVKRWDVDGGGVFTGYASNGTSVRTKISTAEESTGKFYSDAFTATTRHAAYMWQGSERLAVMAEGYIRVGDAIRQTTVGPAGTASALPGPPQGYIIGMLASGTKIVQPYWLAQ